jgi:broad specificity phosphatase PhoE
MSRRIAAFIRHADYHQLADTPSALQPFGLTGKGIKQAEQAAKSITQFIAQHAWCCVAEVDSSPLLRAWQTAKVFTDGGLMVDNKSSTVTCFDALVERSVGSVANLSTTQIEQIIEQDPRFETLPDHWKSNSYFKLPFVGAESLLDAGKRVAEHLTSRMAALPVTEQVQVKLFVGHGASFRHAAYELGILTFDNIAAFSMYHAQPIYLEYFEDGHWRHIAGDWKIRARHSDYTD